ncbi:MAG TPA: LCP family protein [Candidatus Avamphibacillus intestinigallinarum]|nr:LCP family protein [Candidatus Avamphibacillus intestinigallinarum]
MNLGTKRRRSRSKKKKWLMWIGIIILALILLMAGYVFYLWTKASDTMSNIHEPLARDEDPARQKELNDLLKHKDPVNILLLGVDARENDKGRSDTMIVMTLNPKSKSTLMTSIPRDTYVDIPGRGKDKINHAYAFGDVPLSIETVEKTFDIPIHFYARVNMEGFEQGIDTLGGITLENNLDFSQGGHHFTKGTLSLDGKQALEYTRMRKKDPKGDLGRNDRQRKVIQSAMKKATTLSSIPKVDDFLAIADNNVKTNLNQKNIEAITKNYRKTIASSKNVEIQGTGETIGGIWYYIISDDETKRIHNVITDHLKK